MKVANWRGEARFTIDEVPDPAPGARAGRGRSSRRWHFAAPTSTPPRGSSRGNHRWSSVTNTPGWSARSTWEPSSPRSMGIGQRYNCTSAYSDKYGGIWLAQRFRDAGFTLLDPIVSKSNE